MNADHQLAEGPCLSRNDQQACPRSPGPTTDEWIGKSHVSVLQAFRHERDLKVLRRSRPLTMRAPLSSRSARKSLPPSRSSSTTARLGAFADHEASARLPSVVKPAPSSFRHCSVLRPDDVDRVAEAGVTPSRDHVVPARQHHLRVGEWRPGSKACRVRPPAGASDLSTLGYALIRRQFTWLGGRRRTGPLHQLVAAEQGGSPASGRVENQDRVSGPVVKRSRPGRDVKTSTAIAGPRRALCQFQSATAALTYCATI